MVIEILSYKTSIFNPLLKLITVVLFLYGMIYFFRARQKYGGEIRKITDLLLWGGIAGFAASLFRYMGDFVSFWKWGESMMFIMFGLVSLYVAYLVRFRFIEAAKALGIVEEK